MNVAAIPSPGSIGLFCKARRISRLRLFGSAAREDFDPLHSDVDLLVEYESGKHPGLDHFRIAEELSELFGRKVDLNTPTMLGRHLEEVLAGARLLDAMRDAWPEVPWRQIISMRNWLIHGYDGIDLEILWDVLDLRSRELTVQLDEITKAEKMI